MKYLKDHRKFLKPTRWQKNSRPWSITYLVNLLESHLLHLSFITYRNQFNQTEHVNKDYKISNQLWSIWLTISTSTTTQYHYILHQLLPQPIYLFVSTFIALYNRRLMRKMSGFHNASFDNFLFNSSLMMRYCCIHFGHFPLQLSSL